MQAWRERTMLPMSCQCRQLQCLQLVPAAAPEDMYLCSTTNHIMKATVVYACMIYASLDSRVHGIPTATSLALHSTTQSPIVVVVFSTSILLRASAFAASSMLRRELYGNHAMGAHRDKLVLISQHGQRRVVSFTVQRAKLSH